MAVSPSVSAVVFDVGGVLLDWNPRNLYRRLLPDEESVDWFLSEVCTHEWNLEQDRGRPWDEAVAQLTARFPEHAGLITAYHERWQEMVTGPIAGTVEVLGQLHEQGTPLYALTNFSVEKFAQVRDRFEWFDRFRGIVVSGTERLVKPDPQIYRLLLARYSLDPARTLFLDDALVNVAGAREVGMVAVPFAGPERLRADLHRLGVLNGWASGAGGRMT